MKVKEILKEGTDDIEVVIGYDDHCSTYLVSPKHLAAMLNIKDADDLNDYIIDNGKGQDSESCEDGDIFFDLLNKDVAEFHTQIKEVV